MEQEKLVRMRDQAPPRLPDVSVRPHIAGRKSTGLVEAHTNGLRFQSSKGETLDIMYNNVKYGIFQPCDAQNNIVALHFHLKHDIMVGKKRQKDIQLMTEILDQNIEVDFRRTN